MKEQLTELGYKEGPRLRELEALKEREPSQVAVYTKPRAHLIAQIYRYLGYMVGPRFCEYRHLDWLPLFEGLEFTQPRALFIAQLCKWLRQKNHV